MNATRLVELSDLAPDENHARAAAALERFRFSSPRDEDDPLLTEGYAFLAGYFGPKDEIERWSVLRSWAAACAGGRSRPLGPLSARYRMLLAHDEAGALAGARDCYAILDPEARVCVVYLAHALVAPDARRSGLAPLLRAAGATLGRALLAAHGLALPEAELLLAVEQEPIDPEDPDSHVRLSAYGRAGFKAIAPELLPYAQPDFRDLEALDVPPRPLPLLAVVRRVGREQEMSLPRGLASAFVRHLYAVFATHCRPPDLEPPLRRALDALARWPEDQVPLLPLPASPDEAIRATALLRDRVLPLFSEP